MLLVFITDRKKWLVFLACSAVICFVKYWNSSFSCYPTFLPPLQQSAGVTKPAVGECLVKLCSTQFGAADKGRYFPACQIVGTARGGDSLNH